MRRSRSRNSRRLGSPVSESWVASRSFATEMLAVRYTAKMPGTNSSTQMMLRDAASAISGPCAMRTIVVAVWNPMLFRSSRMTGMRCAIARATMTNVLFSRNDTTPAASVATKSAVPKLCVANPVAPAKRRSGEIATRTIHAPAMESAYCAMLKMAFHHGLRVRTSDASAAADWAMIARAGPASSIVANMNAVEVVTSSASSRSGTRIGYSSPTMTRTMSTATAGVAA